MTCASSGRRTGELGHLPTLGADRRTAAARLPRRAQPLCCSPLSGGLDSTVLLHRGCVTPARASRVAPGRRLLRAARHARRSRPARRLRALVGGAAARLAASLGDAAASCVRVECPRRARREPGGGGARGPLCARLHDRLQPGEVLLTAHHADDQLETVLLQLLRGGGLRGLAAMPRDRALRPRAGTCGRCSRFTRDALDRLGSGASGLAWLEDPSNADLRFDRNYLRHRGAARAARTLARRRAHGRSRRRNSAREARRCSRPRWLRTTLPRSAWDARCRLRCARWRCPSRASAPCCARWLRSAGLPLPAARTLAALRRDMATRRERPQSAASTGQARSCTATAAACTPWRASVTRTRDGRWNRAPIDALRRLGPRGRLELVPASRHADSAASACPATLALSAATAGESVPARRAAHTGGRCASGCRSEACCRGVRDDVPLVLCRRARWWPSPILAATREFAARDGRAFAGALAWHGRRGDVDANRTRRRFDVAGRPPPIR